MGKTMAQNAKGPLPFDVRSEGSLIMRRLVIYKQLEREREREREREITLSEILNIT